MKTQKMSLDNMQGKLSRAEMKNVMAGGQIPNSIYQVCDVCGTHASDCSPYTLLQTCGTVNVICECHQP